MWRNKKKKKKKNKANVKIGSIGGGNVGLGNSTSGVTTLSSLVTNIGTSGATTVNIGSTGTTGSSMVNIGLGATGINIGTGSTGTVTIGNANGVVRLNGPLTLGSAPSSSQTGCIGCTISSAAQSPVQITIAGIYTGLVTLTVPVAGLYIINGFACAQTYNNTGTLTNPQFAMNTVSSGFLGVTYGPINIYSASVSAYMQICVIKQLVANDTISLYQQCTSYSGTTTIAGSQITITRIA